MVVDNDISEGCDHLPAYYYSSHSHTAPEAATSTFGKLDRPRSVRLACAADQTSSFTIASGTVKWQARSPQRYRREISVGRHNCTNTMT